MMAVEDEISRKKKSVHMHVDAKLRPCFDYIMKTMNAEFEREPDKMKVQMLLAYCVHSFVKFAAEWGAIGVTYGPPDEKIRNFIAGELVGKFMRIMASKIETYEESDEVEFLDRLKTMGMPEEVN